MSPWNVAWKRYQTEESVEGRKWCEGRERAEAAEWEWNQRHSPNRKGSAMGRETQDRVGVALMEERKEGMVRSGVIDMDECSRKAVARRRFGPNPEKTQSAATPIITSEILIPTVMGLPTWTQSTLRRSLQSS